MGVRKNFPELLDLLIVRNWELTLCSPLINPQILHFWATLGVVVPLMFSFHYIKSLMDYVYRVIIRDSKDLCPQTILFTSFLDLAFIFCWNKCGWNMENYWILILYEYHVLKGFWCVNEGGYISSLSRLWLIGVRAGQGMCMKTCYDLTA